MLRDATAKAIQPTDKPIADGTVIGLRLHATKLKGRGLWKLRFVSPVTHARRDISFGAYPDVAILEARRLGNEARSQIALGIDPLIAREVAKKQIKSQSPILTFREAAERVYADLKSGWKNSKHKNQWLNTLKTYAFPIMGDKPLTDINVPDIAAVLRPIWLKKAETAKRVKQRIHQTMEWSCAQGLRVGNPVSGVQHLLPKQPSASVRVKHHPAMPWRHIPAFIEKHINPANNVTRGLLLFVIMTAVRSGEARGAEWCEFDLERAVWTVPASRMKAQVMHRVPLSGPVIELLKKRREAAAHSDLVFPSPRGKVLTDMALTVFLRKHKAISDTLGRFATAHGYRSSFTDWASESGYPQNQAEIALAHTQKDQVKAAYHRTDLLEQRRPMMENWATFVISTKNVKKN